MKIKLLFGAVLLISLSSCEKSNVEPTKKIKPVAGLWDNLDKEIKKIKGDDGTTGTGCMGCRPVGTYD